MEVLKDDHKPLTAGAMAVKNPDKLAGTSFIFTSAQNNTDVHKPFLAALNCYAAENDSQLLIGQFVYNKNGFQNGVMDADDIYYDKVLQPYFSCDQLEIANGLVWCGELNILPTAKNPLNGFETYTGVNSSIVPHAKIALESIATPKNESCKFMYATGAVTMHNYIQKKAGQVAQHAHCYGALVVEIDDNGVWFARQIQTDDSGSFQDLDKIYNPDGSILPANPIAINWGDIHAEKSDHDVLDCCHEILDDLKPENQLFHDSFDMTARNHHNRKSGHFLAAMHFKCEESVEDDIKMAASVLGDFHRNFVQSHVIESNHDLALEAWLNDNNYDFRTDPVNSLAYLGLQSAIYKNISEEGEMLNILEYALTDFIGDETLKAFNFLSVDDSLIIAGVEGGMHGHIGANGSRGNPNQFQKLNRPINTGHTHSCSIKGSVYTAGVTGSLDMGYNKGASSWSHSHIITYPSGFRTIVTLKNVSRGGAYYKYRA